ncbi:MAG: pilus assembly protein CpaE, partial [Pseudomonadota bacterium]|nr:pilus assembly protein CpaE [Pseudomonadota bacterium]
QVTAVKPTSDTAPDRSTVEGSSDRPSAMAFLLDDNTESALRGGLAEQLTSISIRRGGIRAAVKALRTEPSPRVLLVDVSGLEGDPVKALDDLATVCSPDIKVIVLGDRADIEFYRLVTRRLGVDEYLRKPLTRDAVSSLIGPYLAGAAPDQDRDRGGRIIAVCGARGGAGATTIAVNLALQVSEQTRSHVALLDLNLRGGHAALMLGASPGPGLRAALEDPEHVDGLLLDRVAIAVSDRMRIIAADEPIESDPAPTGTGVNRVVKLLRQRFNVIIIDMPMPPSPAEREALMLARQALIVLNPDVGSLRDAQQAKRLINTQIGAGRTISVLNRATMPGALTLAMVEEGLGQKPEVIIPDLAKQLTRASNLGRPALNECAALGRALTPLTQEISGIDLRPAAGRFARWLRHS